MNVDQALKAAKEADDMGLLGQYPMAAQVLAAEVRAMRKRLATAPVAIMDTRHELGLCAPTEADFPAIQALQGRRVALVDLGPNALAQSGAACGASTAAQG